MKKIIVSTYDDIHNPFYGGGGAIAIHEIFKRLAASYFITVITGKYPGCKDRETIDDINYIRVGSRVNLPRVSQIIYQLLLPIEALRLDYDLWIESFTPPFSVSLLPFIVKTKLIGLVHMLGAADMKRKYHLPFDVVENFGLRFYKFIISPSELNSAKIRLLYPRADIVTIMNGIAPIAGIDPSAPKTHITFLGRLEINQKGLDLLPHAYKKISRKIIYPLLIAGNGEQREINRLRKLICQLDLESQVRLVGRVTGTTEAKLLSQTLILVIPSRFETFSLVAIEAIVTHIPIITFDIEGMKWFPKSCGIKVAPFNTTSFGGSMLKLSRDKSRLQQLIQNENREAHNYSWDRTSQAYARYISQVCAN